MLWKGNRYSSYDLKLSTVELFKNYQWAVDVITFKLATENKIGGR